MENLTIQELIKRYEKKKACLDIYIKSPMIKEKNRLICETKIDCFDKIIEELNSLKP